MLKLFGWKTCTLKYVYGTDTFSHVNNRAGKVTGRGRKGDFLPGADDSVPFFNHRVGDCCDKWYEDNVETKEDCLSSREESMIRWLTSNTKLNVWAAINRGFARCSWTQWKDSNFTKLYFPLFYRLKIWWDWWYPPAPKLWGVWRSFGSLIMHILKLQ